MNTEQLQELKKLALAATPGPWEANGQAVDTENNSAYNVAVCNQAFTGGTWSGTDYAAKSYQLANAAYIAAANPAAVLELIELAERATAAPAESVDTPEFQRLLGRVKDFENLWGGHPEIRVRNRSEFIAHINAWGQQRYEAGRADQTAFFKKCCETDQAEFNRKWLEQKERAECAEAALEEWTHTNKVDELGREVDRLRAALASRPAVDLSSLKRYYCTNEGTLEEAIPGFIDGEAFLCSDVEALLSGKVEAPTGCSKDPNCCPNNEGYGCDCSVSATSQPATPLANENNELGDSCASQQATSATTASADGLPPMPYTAKRWGNSQVQVWSADQVRECMRQARADALEEVIEALRKAMRDAGVVAMSVMAMIRIVDALNKKG